MFLARTFSKKSTAVSPGSLGAAMADKAMADKAMTRSEGMAFTGNILTHDPAEKSADFR